MMTMICDWRLAPLILAAAVFPAAARAADAPTGTWKGTLGKAAVMVCFSGVGDSQYYYLRHRRGIRLAPPEGSGSPREGAGSAGPLALDELGPGHGEDSLVSGRWALQVEASGAIGGTWTSPDKARTLPIALRKLSPAPGDDSTTAGAGCEPAYYAPLVAAMPLARKPATFEGHAYQEISSDEATAIEVPASLPHAQALNRHALGWLREQSILAFDCRTARGGDDTEPIGRTLKPIGWTDRYLVLEDLLPEMFCGGAHGSASLSYQTWSWPQGRMVDTWAWLQGGEKSLVAHAGKQGRPIMSGLFRLLARQHPRNEAGDDCREVLDMMSVEAPYLTAGGLVFNTGFFHAMRACNDQVTLDWAQLRPYLSAEGRAVADQLRRQP